MDRLKKILLIINMKSFAIAFLAVASTLLCRRFGLTADFPFTLITIAIVFPIVFSIGGAYKRREAALDEYGSIKAHGRSIYYAARDWVDNCDSAHAEKAKILLGDLLKACRTLFMRTVTNMEENESAVYAEFSKISLFIKELRGAGMPSGEVSRCNQFLSKMMIAFENVKHIYQYRTPNSLRAYSDLFIVVLPIVYGPYFAEISKDYSKGLIFVMPVLLSLILVSLDNIQEHLENPFDQIGEDDITINAEKFVARLEL